MSEKPVAVLVDNGEPLLEKSVRSLRNQSTPVKILLAPGPDTDMKLAHSLADDVMPPEHGVGKGRVNAILAADSEFILSCDSDSIYDSRYAQYAVEDLHSFDAVRAGTILPHDVEDPLAFLEVFLSLLPQYEFAYAFKKSAFIRSGLADLDYSYQRADFGLSMPFRLLYVLDPRMIVYTRFPTKGAKAAVQYLPAAIGAGSAVLGVASLPFLASLASSL